MKENKWNKLDDETKKKIIADYIECNSYTKVAKLYDVSVETVRRVVKADKDFVKKSDDKKEENILSTLEYMEQQHETKKRILDKLLNCIEIKVQDLENMDKLNIKDLATAYGIILDKELKVKEIKIRNEEVDNNSINQNIIDIASLLNNPVDNRTEDDLNE